MQIKITAVTVQEKIAGFRARQTGEGSQLKGKDDNAPREFSREAFIDLIVEWVVSDDQVRI